jgi:hypothetical protein
MDSNYWVYQSTYEVLGAKVLGGWNVFGLDPTSMFWVTVEWRTENCWARNNLLFWFFLVKTIIVDGMIQNAHPENIIQIMRISSNHKFTYLSQL